MSMNMEDTSDVFEPNKDDRDPANLEFRAGYLRAWAMKLPPGDDREMAFRASRSLRAYAAIRRGDGG